MKNPTGIDQTILTNPIGAVDEFFGVLEPLEVITISFLEC